jgi:hypothetical protein
MTLVPWSPEAAADLEGIVDHVSIDNYALAPEIAESFAQVEMLKHFPQLGRPGNLRDLASSSWPACRSSSFTSCTPGRSRFCVSYTAQEIGHNPARNPLSHP